MVFYGFLMVFLWFSIQNQASVHPLVVGHSMLVFQQSLIDPFGQLNDRVEVVASRPGRHVDVFRISTVEMGSIHVVVGLLVGDIP